MKNNLKGRRGQDTNRNYFDKIVKIVVAIGSKKVFWVLSSVFCITFIVTGVFWYVMLAGVPQLDDTAASAQNAQNTELSYQIVSYNSEVLGEERTYGICLPPGYAENRQQRYPVIFLLHGGNGKPTDWFEKGLALRVIEQVYANGKLPPSIIITPDGNDKRGASPFYDPQYIDGPNGKVKTALGNEMVKIIQSRYRTLPAPRFWAMGGLSSGGWGALNVGLHHLNNFSILFSHSGYFSDRSGAENSPIVYIKRIPRAKRSQLRIYLDAGEQDGKFLEQTKQFARVLKQLKISHVFYQFPGGHNIIGPDSLWNYWHKHLTDSLSYVGQQLRARAARASN